jgi:pantetheine-phosphate adenylyltransferase
MTQEVMPQQGAKIRTAIYPGSFDPVTFGHLDIIRRASRLVDRLIVAVADNEVKGPMFALDRRVELVELALAEEPLACPVQVVGFNQLLVDFARQCQAIMLIRGLRAVSDFEYEFQMAAMNARLANDIETVFLMAADRYHFISSRFVKEIARLGGDVGGFVPPVVVDALNQAIAHEVGA